MTSFCRKEQYDYLIEKRYSNFFTDSPAGRRWNINFESLKEMNQC